MSSPQPQQQSDSAPASPPSAIDAAVAKRDRRRDKAARDEAKRLERQTAEKAAKPKTPKPERANERKPIGEKRQDTKGKPLSKLHETFRLNARTRSEKRVQAAKNRARKNDEAIDNGSEAVQKAFKRATKAQKAELKARGNAREIHNIKWRALDKTHVAVNMVYRTFWRVELDANFNSYAHLLLKLQMMVKDGMIPCLPHIIVWIPTDTLPQGTCNHPHLWFTLPEDAGVYGKGNVSDRMMRGVIAALTAALAPLGADPGGLANPHDGKNPLCPNAQYRIPNDTHLPRLDGYAETLDVSIDTDSMARILSIRTLERTNVGKRSQQMYDWIYSASTTIAAELHKKGIVDANDKPFDRYRFGEIVESELKRRGRIEFPELSGAELEAMLAVCETKATWAAEKFDVMKLSSGVNRGAIRDQIEETDTLAEKQGKGGTYSRRKVKNDNVNLVAKAMVIDVKRDRAPDIDLLAKTTGLHPRTIKAHYPAALKIAQGIVHHYAVNIISIALTPILNGKESSLGKGCTLRSTANHGEASANRTGSKRSEADPVAGDPGPPPNCSFEAFVDAHHRSRFAAASASVH